MRNVQTVEEKLKPIIFRPFAQILFNFLTKQSVLMRRSTVLNIPPRLVFPEGSLLSSAEGEKHLCLRLKGRKIERKGCRLARLEERKRKGG